MSGENPFKTDEKLRQLLADVGSIQSGKVFSDWKVSFLRVYRNYLDPDGVLNARDANVRLIKKLQRYDPIIGFLSIALLLSSCPFSST